MPPSEAKEPDLTHPFDDAIALEPTEATGFICHLDPAFWVSTSGPWGGYISALFARAFERTIDDLPLMSLTVHVLRRLDAGRADLVVDVESRGRRVAHVSARLVQEGRPGAIAVATLARNDGDERITDFPRPDAPPAEDVRRRAESAHPYMQHFDVRPTTVIHPWSGTNDGTLQGWISTVEPRALDVPLLVALPDAWMPGSWARLTTPAGKITLNLTVTIRSAPTPQDTGWWFVRVRSRHIERGFADEECEIWGADGSLLAQSRQLVLLAR